MKWIFFLTVLGFSNLLFWSCKNASNELEGVVTINVREGIGNSSTVLQLEDEIESIECIPLETSDSALISNILDLRMSDNYIFIYNGKTSEIFQFNREGKFIRKIGREGNGPGEYSLITELGIDESYKRLYIFQYDNFPLVYSFEGEFLSSDSTMSYTGGIYVFDNGNKALKGLVMNPTTNAPWAGALMDRRGEVIMSKSLYNKQNDNEEYLYMKEICFSSFGDRVLFSTLCNDTIYSISSTNIVPQYILDRSNIPGYYKFVCDFRKMNDPILNSPETIGIYDMFETYKSLYVRVYMGENIYIQRFNKKTHELESYLVPEDFKEYSEAIPGNNIIGIDSKFAYGIPFWPEYYVKQGMRAQVVSSYGIGGLKEKGYLGNLPSNIDIDEDDNPVIIIYKFKQ